MTSLRAGLCSVARVFRSVALIVAAIQLTRPQIPEEEATRYARVLQSVAKEHDFDPFSVVAIVHFESGWLPHVVSSNREDHGLGQIRARYVGACRHDADPLDHPSDACRQVKAMLLHGESNLRQIGIAITEARKLCKQKTGTAWFQQWLAAYQGLNFPKEGKWCQPKQKTWRVIEYRKKLIAELVQRPRPPAKKPGSKPPPPKKR